MPEYTHVLEDEAIMTIDSSSGRVVFQGVPYHNPCTFEAENGFAFLKEVPLDILQTIDFGNIARHAIIEDGNGLSIEPINWNCIFFDKLSTPAPSLLGSRRFYG